MSSTLTGPAPRLFRSKIGAACLLAAASLCTSGAALASVVVSESFTYADGALDGQNGGTGWNGGWTTGGSVAGGAASLTSNTSSDRRLSTAIVPTAGQGLYLSMSLGADPSASTFDYAGLAFLSGGLDTMFFGLPFERDEFGFGVNRYTTQKSGVAASMVPSFLVAEILFNTATNVTVNLFVDPVGVLGAANATYTGSMLGGSWDSVRIVNNNSRSTFDDIVIGTTLADVYSEQNAVPEPSSLALAGLALLGVTGLMRRRRAA